MVIGFVELVIIGMTVVSFGGYGIQLAVILSNKDLLTYTNRLIVALSISDVSQFSVNDCFRICRTSYKLLGI